MKTEHFLVNSSSPRRQQSKAASFKLQEQQQQQQEQQNINSKSLFAGSQLTSDNLRRQHRQFSGYSDRDSVCSGLSSARGKRLKSRNFFMKSAKGVTKKTKTMDYTNYAYNEAVGRLKLMLADSYATPKASRSYQRDLKEDSDNYSDTLSVIERPVFSDISKYLSPSQKSRISSYRPRKNLSTFSTSKENLGLPTSFQTAAATGYTPDYMMQKQQLPTDSVQAPVEIFNFIGKQEDYIEQLEKESKYCRNELSNLLGKVKDVIHENEQLTENARSELAAFTSAEKLQEIATSPSSDSDELHYGNKKAPSTPTRKKDKLPRYASAPNIVYEARISELEAELMQANIDLKRLKAENEELKRKVSHTDALALVPSSKVNCDAHRKQIEHLQMDKNAMEETIRHLQKSLDEAKSEQYTNSSKRYINDLVQMERSQAELEVKHLRDELDRQHERVRELQHEMSRRIAEERSNAERRYNNQVDQLGGDLSNQWEQVAKLQLEIERQKRYESDVKRDLASRNAQIEELKMELRSNRSTFLADIAQVNAEKQSLEQEITALRMQLDRAARENKTEASRLNAEINSLRQRLDRADADLLHSKREVLRLNDEIAGLEKELAYGELKNEIRPTKKDLDQRISEMQSKHAETVNELEDMIQNQKQLMDKLTSECKLLTNKLEDTTLKHNQEKQKLRETNLQLLARLKQIWCNYKELMVRHDELKRLSAEQDTLDSVELPAADSIQSIAEAVEEEEHLLNRTYDIKKPLSTTSRPHMIQPSQRNSNLSPMSTQSPRPTVTSPYLENQLQMWQMLSPQQQLQQLQQRQLMTKSNMNTQPMNGNMKTSAVAAATTLVTTNQATLTTLTMTKISKTALVPEKSSSNNNNNNYRQSTVQSPKQHQHPQHQQQQHHHQHSINTTTTSTRTTPQHKCMIQTWPQFQTTTTPTTAPTKVMISSNMMQMPTTQVPTNNSMALAWSNMTPQVKRTMPPEHTTMETIPQPTMIQVPISIPTHQHPKQQLQPPPHQRPDQPLPLNQQRTFLTANHHQQQQQQQYQHPLPLPQQHRHRHLHQRSQRQQYHHHQQRSPQYQQQQAALQQQRADHNRERAQLLWGQQLPAEQSAEENPLCHNSLPRQPTKSSCDALEFQLQTHMIDPFELEFTISSPSLMRSSSGSDTCTEIDNIEFDSISQMSFSPPVTAIKRLSN